MKKVMSVSVEERVLDLAREASHESRLSFSKWVEEAIKVALRKESPKSKNPDIEAQKKNKVYVGTESPVVHFSEADTPPTPETKQDSVKAKKIGDVKGNIRADKEVVSEAKDRLESLTGHSGSYSKDSQVGKKGGK